MRKIVFGGSGPTVGMDYMEACFVDDTITSAELDTEAWERAIDNVEMYGFSYDPECEGDYETCTNGDDIEGWWAEYDPEEHDGHLIDNPFKDAEDE